MAQTETAFMLRAAAVVAESFTCWGRPPFQATPMFPAVPAASMENHLAATAPRRREELAAEAVGLQTRPAALGAPDMFSRRLSRNPRRCSSRNATVYNPASTSLYKYFDPSTPSHGPSSYSSAKVPSNPASVMILTERFTSLSFQRFQYFACTLVWRSEEHT